MYEDVITFLRLVNNLEVCQVCKDFIYRTACSIIAYLAAWHYPVSNGQEGQPDGDPQHGPALHSNRLLPQTRQVLVPDREQLLLTVWMGNKLEKNRKTQLVQLKSDQFHLFTVITEL